MFYNSNRLIDDITTHLYMLFIFSFAEKSILTDIVMNILKYMIG